MVLLTLQAIEISTFFLDNNRMKRSIYENVRKALRTPTMITTLHTLWIRMVTSAAAF